MKYLLSILILFSGLSHSSEIKLECEHGELFIYLDDNYMYEYVDVDIRVHHAIKLIGDRYYFQQYGMNNNVIPGHKAKAKELIVVDDTNYLTKDMTKRVLPGHEFVCEVLKE